MALSASGRRWLGVVVLGIALLMLVGGQFFLQTALRGLGYLAYWLVCLILTGAAIVIAFADVRATRTEIRRQERELIERTIQQIQSDAAKRPKHKPS